MDEAIEGSPGKDGDIPNFRQLALSVSQDETLEDPFFDGEGEDNPTESRDALKAILTKHFGYTPEDVEEAGDQECRFTGRYGQPIAIRTAANSNGETCLDFKVGDGETRRLISASLKLGVPIAFALAHQNPDQLTRIYKGRTKEPHVSKACTFEVNQQSPGSPDTRTNIFTLQSARVWNSESFLGGRI
ncbi:MAG TPA: hypothetical protein VM077_02830 [Candidatus Limnocylindrales bacterium]|nr:hypothetical protein [Candidatus Limnocylindrales bacterium]